MSAPGIPLGPLYHWAPKRLRWKILRDGLAVMSDGRTSQDSGEPCRFPWICFGTTPSAAWGMILDPDSESPEEREGGLGWDLWEVVISENDSLRIRGDFAPFIREVRIENSVPADRVWWVGERFKWPHDSEEVPEP